MENSIHFLKYLALCLRYPLKEYCLIECSAYLQGKTGRAQVGRRGRDQPLAGGVATNVGGIIVSPL